MLSVFLTVLVVACSDQSAYKYKYVQGDPMKTRIYTLHNGLKVYLTVNPEEPKIQANIAVKVGGKNDPAETTGLAHYFEHLMFKGTDKFGTQNYEQEKPMLDEIERLFEVYRKTTGEAERAALYHKIDSISYEASRLAIPNEYDKLMAAIGSDESNAYTGEDMTVYVENIPSNEVDNWAKIQAERFENAVIRGFHTELEAVYEEKNMSLTQDGNKALERLMAALFPHHPYGTQTVLGSQEHLKNPSITNIKNYYKQWYVPNNMAICMSGDLNPDSVIVILDKYFGRLQPNPELPKLQFQPEKPITAPVVEEVLGVEAEQILIGWRFPGAASRESELLQLTEQVLCNGTAGLIDLNVSQQQRLLEAGVYAGLMADYSFLLMAANPKEGQSLEEARDILLGEVDKLKRGDFDENLLEAAVNNFKLGLQAKLESNEARADWLAESFINGSSWKDEVEGIGRLSKITKQQIVDFANANLKNDNYAVVYKRQGKDPNEKKIDKPEITPIFTNRDTSSRFLKEVQSNRVKPIEPVFVDYSKDMEKGMAKADIPVLYKYNNTNGLFTLTYVFEIGRNDDKVLGTAARYIKYLGTDQMDAEQLRREFYRLACNYWISAGEDRVSVGLTGLEENRVKAMELFESLLADAQPNAEVLENMKGDIRKARVDAKSNQGANFSRLRQYGLYGPYSPATAVLSDSELDELQPEDLLGRLRKLNSYEHRVMYYGPASLKQVITEVNALHRTPEKLTPVVKKAAFRYAETPENKVLLAPYDARQIYMTAVSNRGEKFDVTFDPVIALYNEYFGGGMNSIVFQEMREVRGLAYDADAGLNEPSKWNRPYLFTTFIATQNDKVKDALAAFDQIINDMPLSENAFQLAKEALLTRIRTTRTTKADVLWSYVALEDLGLTEDRNRALFEGVQKLTLDDVKAFQEKWVKGRKYVYCVLGDEKELDMKALSKYGTIIRLKTEDIFGY